MKSEKHNLWSENSANFALVLAVDSLNGARKVDFISVIYLNELKVDALQDGREKKPSDSANKHFSSVATFIFSGWVEDEQRYNSISDERTKQKSILN